MYYLVFDNTSLSDAGSQLSVNCYRGKLKILKKSFSLWQRNSNNHIIHVYVILALMAGHFAGGVDVRPAVSNVSVNNGVRMQTPDD